MEILEKDLIEIVELENGKYAHFYNGEKMYEEEYDFVEEFKDGYAVVGNELAYFHINEKGEKLYEDTFEDLYDFYDGLAVACKNNRYLYIKTDGTKLNDETYMSAEDFYKGIGFVEIFKGTYKAINTEGKYVNNEIYDTYAYFRHDIGIILQKKVYKVIDLKVETIKPIESVKYKKKSEVLNIYQNHLGEYVFTLNGFILDIGELLEVLAQEARDINHIFLNRIMIAIDKYNKKENIYEENHDE